mmetsp:Transcript_24252/g.84246  ORF Transcript_24252/g.84246 Transcript_24252/m.84246 type:complete len:698 (+) Transcript_24252:245-2338(+)
MRGPPSTTRRPPGGAALRSASSPREGDRDDGAHDDDAADDERQAHAVEERPRRLRGRSAAVAAGGVGSRVRGCLLGRLLGRHLGLGGRVGRRDLRLVVRVRLLVPSLAHVGRRVRAVGRHLRLHVEQAQLAVLGLGAIVVNGREARVGLGRVGRVDPAIGHGVRHDHRERDLAAQQRLDPFHERLHLARAVRVAGVARERERVRADEAVARRRDHALHRRVDAAQRALGDREADLRDLHARRVRLDEVPAHVHGHVLARLQVQLQHAAARGHLAAALDLDVAVAAVLAHERHDQDLLEERDVRHARAHLAALAAVVAVGGQRHDLLGSAGVRAALEEQLVGRVRRSRAARAGTIATRRSLRLVGGAHRLRHLVLGERAALLPGEARRRLHAALVAQPRQRPVSVHHRGRLAATRAAAARLAGDRPSLARDVALHLGEAAVILRVAGEQAQLRVLRRRSVVLHAREVRVGRRRLGVLDEAVASRVVDDERERLRAHRHHGQLRREGVDLLARILVAVLLVLLQVAHDVEQQALHGGKHARLVAVRRHLELELRDGDGGRRRPHHLAVAVGHVAGLQRVARPELADLGQLHGAVAVAAVIALERGDDDVLEEGDRRRQQPGQAVVAALHAHRLELHHVVVLQLRRGHLAARAARRRRIAVVLCHHIGCVPNLMEELLRLLRALRRAILALLAVRHAGRS